MLSAPVLSRSGQGSFDIPSIQNYSRLDGRCFYTSFFSPFRYALGFAVECQWESVAGVAILLSSGAPLDIARLIIAVVVDAIQGIAIFPIVGEIADVVVECGEGILSFCTNLYAAATIIFIANA